MSSAHFPEVCRVIVCVAANLIFHHLWCCAVYIVLVCICGPSFCNDIELRFSCLPIEVLFSNRGTLHSQINHCFTYLFQTWHLISVIRRYIPKCTTANLNASFDYKTLLDFEHYLVLYQNANLQSITTVLPINKAERINKLNIFHIQTQKG